MRKMCVIPKQVIDDWLLNQKTKCCPGPEQRLELACHIAGLDELKGYPVGGLVARLLPNGDIRVKTPEERMQWHVEDADAVEEAPIESPAPPAVGSDAGFWCFVGFLLGVIATELVWIIGDNWEALT